MTHLEEVLRRFSEAGLIINVDKCVFAKSEVLFLGHLVTEKGILPSPDRVNVIKQIERPITVQQLKRFLGMIHFYRRFIPSAARDQTKLNFLKGYKKTVRSQLNGPTKPSKLSINVNLNFVRQLF